MYDIASVLRNHTSNMKLVPFAHIYRIRSSPFCLESTTVPGGLLGGWLPTSGDSMLCMAWPWCMRGLFCTCVGVRDLLYRYANLSYSSIWRDVMSLPFLKSNACNIENPKPHLLQCRGNSGYSAQYCRNTASLHSCAENSIPFTMYGATKSHDLIFCPRQRRRLSIW